MSLRKLASSLTLLAGLSLAVTTCGGASFDDPSKIKGLRVLAVQKSAPYPKPGELVNLKLVYWDGKSSEDNPRSVFVAISPVPCENPPGDLYFNCLSALGGMPDGGAVDMPDAGVPDGDPPESGAARERSFVSRGVPAALGAVPHSPPFAPSNVPGVAGFVPISYRSEAPLRDVAPSGFVRATRSRATSQFQDVDHVREATIRISDDIIERHPVAPGVQPYGLAYVLFLACAGTPKPVPNAGPNALPFGCFDADDRQLGPDDFVIGYTSLYVYNERSNHNPVIDDFVFDGASLAGSTTDDANAPHVPSCKESDRNKCPKHVLKPAINREATVEKDDDPSAKTPDGQQLEEQAWVNYYLTGGELKSSVRLVNDATRGWNEKHEGEFTAPAEPGPVRVFAVVHDNRGGIAWAEGKIIVD